MRILFIEDEQDSIVPVKDLCQDQLPDVALDVTGFDDAEYKLRRFRPEIVILDLVKGSPSDSDAAGLSTYEFIWSKQFCPIVVYSARSELLDDEEWPPHPFVKKVQKGSGSPRRVLEAIQEFVPHVKALQKTEDVVRDCLSLAIRDVAEFAFRTFNDATQREEAIMRSGRRRIAAMMDEPPRGEPALAAWECYLYPPVLSDTQLGDILQSSGGDSNDPSSFRVVLTPSCDMVQSNSQTPKVQAVLTAKCYSMQEALPLVGLANNTKPTVIRDRILSSGYAQAIIPFPSLGNLIPLMAANLRDLELVPITDIGLDNKFVRTASLDSPFRELVAWGYMQIACRPGLPDRDLDSWAREITGLG